MCDAWGDGPDLWTESRPKARKEHQCYACGETIRRGDTHNLSKGLYDGEWSSFRHCLRCDAMLRALAWAGQDGAQLDLNCGEDWRDTIGELPDHVAALAFWLPGEPIPTPQTEETEG